MISINPVQFPMLTPGSGVYRFNPQYLTSLAAGARKRFEPYSDCRFEVSSRSAGEFPLKDSVGFTCVNATDRERHRRHGEILLYKTDFPPIQNSRGSLLVKHYADWCHACGRYRDDCWRDWAGHYICELCRVLGATAPYAYGIGVVACCNNYGCGQQMKQAGLVGDYSSLFELAVEIRERHLA